MKRTLVSHGAMFLLGMSLFGLQLTVQAAPFPQQLSTAKSIATKQPSINWDTVNAMYPFLNSLTLTPAQRDTLSQMIDQQMSAIYSNISALENAKNLLREMALSKQYDETIAKVAAERIANSSASLAILQAEREYQLFSILTESQTRLYEDMKAKGLLSTN